MFALVKTIKHEA